MVIYRILELPCCFHKVGPFQTAALSCRAVRAGVVSVGLVLGMPLKLWGYRGEQKWDPGLSERLFGVDTMPSVVWHLQANENETLSVGAI